VELIRQLRALERNPEDPTGAWRKDQDQHGPDALVALAAPIVERQRKLAARQSLAKPRNLLALPTP
jgi:hypothetical protein